MLETLFTQALGLASPWTVRDVDFNDDQGAIHFKLHFADPRATCPVCGAHDQPIHDRLDRSWQHLHFFQYRAFLHAAVPRVACSGCGKTTQIPVPWAQPRSGFTALFEAYALMLARRLPVAEVARMLGVQPQQLWQRLNRMVDAAYAKESFAEVRSVTVDETAMRRGHQYVTVVADAEARRVIFVTEGKDQLTLSDFASELKSHNATPEQITDISMDFSKAFQAGAAHLPNAEISFDPFHLVALASEAVDQVRRTEVKTEPSLRKQRYSLLKDPAKLTRKQARFADTLPTSNLKTARAWRFKEALRDLVRDKPDRTATQSRLEQLICWAQRSRLEPIVKLGRTLREHADGIVRAISEKRSNGFAEGLNSAIQAAKQRARGFKTAENFISIIYLIAGKLSNLPASPMRTRGSKTPAFT